MKTTATDFVISKNLPKFPAADRRRVSCCIELALEAHVEQKRKRGSGGDRHRRADGRLGSVLLHRRLTTRDPRFEAVHATYCEKFAISPVELGKRIEAICDTSEVVGAQELPPIVTGAGRVEPIRYQGRGRGVGRSPSLPAALRIQGQAAMTNAILTIAAALLLSACAASPPAHGNAKGGVIDWFGTNSVQAEADRRKQYGKLARITEMRGEAGGHVLFECV